MKTKFYLIIIGFFINTIVFGQNKFNLNDLKSLKTYYNLPDSVFDEVEKIYVQNIQQLPDDINKYKNLKEISIIGNDWDENFTNLPESFFKLKKLISLNISYTDLSSISPSIKQLQSLIKLNICNNKLTELPIELSDLPNLKEIYINNSITKIPNLPQIECLHYNYWYDEEEDTAQIFDNISEMKSLKKIIIDGSGLFDYEGLIKKIANADKIEEFEISNSYFNKQDLLAVSNLNQLKILKCQSLVADSMSISNFKNLEYLSFVELAMEDSAIKTTMKALQNLPKLKSINARFDTSWTKYLNYSQRINFDVCINYDDFYSYNYTEEIFSKIKDYNIDSLTIMGNSDLDGIVALKQLRVLNLLNNEIFDEKNFIENLTKLPKLEKLYLSGTIFSEEIPENITLLKQLKNIYIFDTRPYFLIDDESGIPDETKEKLKKMLPNCKFYYYE